MQVKCPKCGALTALDAGNRFRPFCSERCSILDLGAWADEQYKVPVAVQETESVNENGDEETSSPHDRTTKTSSSLVD